MTHEFKKLIQGYFNARHVGLSCVTATVVALDGSSYRRPGVRMLINENGHMTGAVSGGCVEKEILKQSQSVFRTGVSKMISYDGRYRLGCEGTLYILIERFDPSTEMLTAFEQTLNERIEFEVNSSYLKTHGQNPLWGSEIQLGSQSYPFDSGRSSKVMPDPDLTEAEIFSQRFKPCFKLVIVGAEHDAAQLSIAASHLGWEVTVVAGPSNPSTLKDFPGAEELIKASPENLDLKFVDDQVAVVLMTHSYVRDLNYLIALKDARPCYIGLLGPSNRRERVLNDLIETSPGVNDELFQVIFGPAGLNIGAETPEEIAISICSEILAVIRGQEPKSLKDKSGSIHHNIRY
jgi:xanthine/CO dehydrogenase XdhC/CoxF family maturation factor